MTAKHKDVSKYRFGRALRPFSLVVAVASCGLGISFAFRSPEASVWAAVAVLFAGLFLQAGVNLINDSADLFLPDTDQLDETSRVAIRTNFRIGLAAITVSALLGVALLLQGGWPLLLILLLGLIGALGYTLEPLNYKRRGLGVPLVFWLMGVLMVSGSQLAVSGEWLPEVLWLSLPLSLLVAALLLSNELRDFESDAADGILTLSQRLGWTSSRSLFLVLLLVAPLWNLFFTLAGLLPFGWLTLFSLVLLSPVWRLLPLSASERMPLVPATGRYLAAFGLLNIVAVWLS